VSEVIVDEIRKVSCGIKLSINTFATSLTHNYGKIIVSKIKRVF